MTIQSVFSKAGYTVKGLDNRNRAIKSLNEVFSNSAITMDICESGRVWVGKDQFKYNVRIQLPGVATTRFNTKDVTPYSLLKMMGKFLRRDEVRVKIYAETEVPHKCDKCDGAGILPAFMYYADGVCFDCLGVGIVGKLSVKNVCIRTEKEKTGFHYLNTFRITGNYSESFPQGVENIHPVTHFNHPTAIVFLGKKDNDYYIHAPICQRNDWYKIPESDFEKFTEQWNKYTPEGNPLKSHYDI